MTIQNDLIIDVGMHTGKDTLFYLKKGFRVVAVEANPALVNDNSRKFATYIDTGALQIVPLAISDHEGKSLFYLNESKDDWGTLSPAVAERNVKRGARNLQIEVQCVRFEYILEEYGIPYYLKVDIEGNDLLCVQALWRFQHRPKYVSMELTTTNVRQSTSELDTLYRLGYQKFKLIDQSINHTYCCPYPPLEGKYVDTVFDTHTSGPFGEEAPGTWCNVEKILSKLRRITLEQLLFSPEGKLAGTISERIYNAWCRRWARRNGIGWYDIHACLEQ